MSEQVKARLCVDTLKSAIMAYPGLRGAIIPFRQGKPIYQL